ncbi:anti-sigma factor family protein [Tamilnaduibacter salinus]|nr:zf-HC2 domain-containing protein [Tamilnaduibacter salinus]
MTCREIRENLALYTVDSLSDDERQAVEVHVETCEACARALALEQRVTEALQDQPVPTPSAGFEQRVLAAATGTSAARGSRWTTPVVGGAVAAACGWCAVRCAVSGWIR